MDAASEHAAQFVDALAIAYNRLRRLTVALRRVPSVTQVLHDLDLVARPKWPPLAEAYVEAECSNGDVICYWLEISLADSQWVVETRVMINGPDRDCQDTLQEFPNRCAATLEGVVAELSGAVSNLITAAEQHHHTRLDLD